MLFPFCTHLLTPWTASNSQFPQSYLCVGRVLKFKLKYFKYNTKMFYFDVISLQFSYSLYSLIVAFQIAFCGRCIVFAAFKHNNRSLTGVASFLLGRWSFMLSYSCCFNIRGFQYSCCFKIHVVSRFMFFQDSDLIILHM